MLKQGFLSMFKIAFAFVYNVFSLYNESIQKYDYKRQLYKIVLHVFTMCFCCKINK